jgi:hypothetical protein
MPDSDSPTARGLPASTIAVIPRTGEHFALVVSWLPQNPAGAPPMLRLALYNRSRQGLWHLRADRGSHAINLLPSQLPALIDALSRAVTTSPTA